jgi:hypothetical protein
MFALSAALWQETTQEEDGARRDKIAAARDYADTQVGVLDRTMKALDPLLRDALGKNS